MNQIKNKIKELIPINEEEWSEFIAHCSIRTYNKKQIISRPSLRSDYTLFINKGILRFYVTDLEGNIHTTHFSIENEFTGDYPSLLLNKPSIYTIQALEDMEVVLIPFKAIKWGYENMQYGDRLGRLIAESYFIFMDSRIRNNYIISPKERYNNITEIFPNIHNRVPQHMIASYLGITPVHLSRLKKKKD